MPIHSTDLANIELITNHAPLPDGFDATYDAWAAAVHKLSNGPIGLLIIPLCDKFGILPGAPRLSEMTKNTVDWLKVPKNTPVIVATTDRDGNPIEARGRYRRKGHNSVLEICLDGKGDWIDEFPNHTVKLAPDAHDAFSQPASPQPVKAADAQAVRRPHAQRVSKTFDRHEAVKPVDDGWPIIPVPRLDGLSPGDELTVLVDDELVAVEFSAVGPGSHQFTGFLPGSSELELFDEIQLEAADEKLAAQEAATEDAAPAAPRKAVNKGGRPKGPKSKPKAAVKKTEPALA